MPGTVTCTSTEAISDEAVIAKTTPTAAGTVNAGKEEAAVARVQANEWPYWSLMETVPGAMAPPPAATAVVEEV